MTANKPITIIGGGLAGLTLGIGLRRRGVPVTIWEAGNYPRHRVCGEFISGRGQASLTRLGLREKLIAAGTIPARSVAFFSERMASRSCELPEPAWSLSRYALDDLLANEFRNAGGELKENTRWRDATVPEGTVRASGRRVQPVVNGWRWFGLKIHARNMPLTADLEMHLWRGGYMGMSRLKNGEINICGLFRRPPGEDGPKKWQLLLRGERGTPRYQRLERAEFDEQSFCSVAGLSLTPRRAAESTECCLGDSIAMIPPVTGNGMSMAFESAEIAADPLADYSAGKISWTDARQTLARKCDVTFARRLAWAAWLQRLMFMPSLQNTLVLFAPRWNWLWRLLVSKTR